MTNLSLNLFLSVYGSGTGTVLLLEIVVVVAEYVLYFSAYGRKNGLLFLVAASNMLSFLIGKLIYA